MAKKQNHFVLTEKHIENAERYLPLALKGALAQTLAIQCLEKVDSPHEGVPPMYCLSPVAREMALMNVLCAYYLKVTPQDQDLNMATYNFYAGGDLLHHIFNTDISRDYHTFKQMLDTVIQSELARLNDPCARIIAMIEAQSTPEAVNAAVEQLQAVGKEIENFRPVALMKQKSFDDATKDMKV